MVWEIEFSSHTNGILPPHYTTPKRVGMVWEIPNATLVLRVTMPHHGMVYPIGILGWYGMVVRLVWDFKF